MTIKFTPEALLQNVKVSTYLFISKSEQDQANKKALFDLVNVDLSKPGKCVFLYQIFLKPEFDQGDEIYGVIETTTEWAIAIVQDTINTVYERIWWEAGKDGEDAPKIPITGIFDCATANAMLLPAQIVRGTGVGNVDYMPLNRDEFLWCMDNSEILPDLIEYAFVQHGIDENDLNDKLQETYKTLVPQDKFVAGAKIPDSCEGIKPVSEDIVGTKTGQQQDEDWTWPIILGSIAGVTLIVMGWIAWAPPKEQMSEQLVRRG